MKGREVINHLTQHEMPDLQVVKGACHARAVSRNASKNSRMRWSAVAAATIMACLFITTAAVATGHHMGAFDRLRSIIGSEQAETLTPIEMVLSRNGFNASGLRGELVAVGAVDGNVVDVFLTLEDLTGNRLVGDFDVFAYLMYGTQRSMMGWSRLTNEINRTDYGMVTLYGRHVFSQPISGSELAFVLHSIQYTARENRYAVDFDLGTLTEQIAAAFLWDTPILQPHQHDISIALPGFERAGDINISSMGLIDGRLHIQEQYDAIALNRWVGNKVQLINPYGEIVHPLRGTRDNTATVSFRINEQGEFYNDRGFNFVVDFPYRENIFAVDAQRLSEYRLVAPLRIQHTLTLNWHTEFDMEMPHAQIITLDALDITLDQYASVIHEIRILPMNVFITASRLDTTEYGRSFGLFANSYDTFTRPHIQLRTIHGDLIDVEMGGTALVDFDTATFKEMMFIKGDSVDLDVLDAILIDGEVIEIR